MKKIIIFSIAVITIFSACNRVDYIAKGDNKFDLVFITTNKDAENYWAPLTALVDEYFGTVIIPLNSDSTKAMMQLQKMMDERKPATMTLFFTSEAANICNIFCSNNKEKISMSIQIDDIEQWKQIHPEYMQATKDFYSEYEKRVDLLTKNGFNDADTTQCEWNYELTAEEKEKIMNYFQLDTVINDKKETWQKALAIGKFVSTNIPHGNQKTQPLAKDAITLWEFTKAVEPAINCRLHSFFTSQLLTSAGIKNRILTCLPYDSTDGDCHVVNIVWIPEQKKWAMLDTDQSIIVVDENGTPLSPFEMRRHYTERKHFTILSNYTEPIDNMDYYTSYMAKNTFWFASPVDYSDTIQNCLVPAGMKPWAYNYNYISTQSEIEFSKE